MSAAEWAAYARKGLVALVGALSQVGVALAGASDGGSSVTAQEWVAVALAAAAAVGVYAIPNRAPDRAGRHEAPAGDDTA